MKAPKAGVLQSKTATFDGKVASLQSISGRNKGPLEALARAAGALPEL